MRIAWEPGSAMDEIHQAAKDRHEEERKRRVKETKLRAANWYNHMSREIAAGNAFRNDYLDTKATLEAVTKQALEDTEDLHAQLARAKKRARELKKLIVEPAAVRPAKRAAVKRVSRSEHNDDFVFDLDRE